MFNYL